MDEQSNLHPTVFIPNPLVSLVNGLDPFALGALATSRVGVGLQCVRIFFSNVWVVVVMTPVSCAVDGERG